MVCTFGIALWPLYTGRDYMSVLESAGIELALSLPIFDPRTLFNRLDLFRWPAELSTAEKIPLALSTVFLVVELLLELWQNVEPKLAGEMDAAWHAPKLKDTDAYASNAIKDVAKSWRSRRWGASCRCCRRGSYTSPCSASKMWQRCWQCSATSSREGAGL